MKDEKFVKTLIDLYNQGLNDYEIGKILGVKECTVYWWRHRKLNLTPTKKVNLEKYKDYILSCVNNRIPIRTICKKVSCTPLVLRNYLKKLGFSDLRHLKRNDYKIGPREMGILVGTLLGDATMYSKSKQCYPRLSFRHCLQQKIYTQYLYSNLRSLKPRLSTVIINPHKIGNKYVGQSRQIEVKLPANKQLIYLYNNFYKDGKKVIPFDLLYKYYNREALAIHFMDDGSKDTDKYGNIEGFIFSTNCFTIEELKTFKGFLLGKFGLHCTVIEKSHLIRIQAKSVERFIYLVKPYITSDLLYKISPQKIS